MSNIDTELIPYVCDLLTNTELYSENEIENACSALLVLEQRIREANYDEVLDDFVSSEEFEEFFVDKLEAQGKGWKVDKVRQMIKSEEEENDIR